MHSQSHRCVQVSHVQTGAATHFLTHRFRIHVELTAFDVGTFLVTDEQCLTTWRTDARGHGRLNENSCPPSLSIPLPLSSLSHSLYLSTFSSLSRSIPLSLFLSITLSLSLYLFLSLSLYRFLFSLHLLPSSSFSSPFLSLLTVGSALTLMSSGERVCGTPLWSCPSVRTHTHTHTFIRLSHSHTFGALHSCFGAFTLTAMHLKLFLCMPRALKLAVLTHSNKHTHT